MIRTPRLLGAGLLLIAVTLAIAPASAWTIQKWTGPENGALLVPGTATTTTFTIHFDSWTGGKFDSDHTIALRSDLANPKWVVTKAVQKDDERLETSQLVSRAAAQVNLDSWSLTDSAASYDVNVQMSGTVPLLNESQEITLVRVQEVDSAGAVIKGSMVKKTGNVVVPTTEPTAAPAPAVTPEETEIVITPVPTTAAPAVATVITPAKKHTYSPAPGPLAICGVLAGVLLVLGLAKRRN